MSDVLVESSVAEVYLKDKIFKVLLNLANTLIPHQQRLRSCALFRLEKADFFIGLSVFQMQPVCFKQVFSV